MDLKGLSEKIINDNYLINRREALDLANCDLDTLRESAKNITKAFSAIRLNYVLFLMENAADALKIVNSAHKADTLKQRLSLLL